QSSEPATRLEIIARPRHVPASALRVGVLGAGNFSLATLIPAIKAVQGVALEGLCASHGPQAYAAAKKFGFSFCTTETDDIFSNPSINAVVIATRHHLHAQQVVQGLESGKHVFCEKPLCLKEEELENIRSAHARA